MSRELAHACGLHLGYSSIKIWATHTASQRAFMKSSWSATCLSVLTHVDIKNIHSRAELLPATQWLPPNRQHHRRSLSPTKTLTTLASVTAEGFPETTTATKLQSNIRHIESQTRRNSVRSQFPQTASTRLSAGSSFDVVTSYKTDNVDTIQLKYDPTEDDVAPLLQTVKCKM